MKILVVDPSSYTLPYDFNYINLLSDLVEVDFYCSKVSGFDTDAFIKIKSKCSLYSEMLISPSVTNRLTGTCNYIAFLFKLVRNYKKYDYIHFQWSIFFLLELPFFLLFRKKLIFTMHNDVPHGYKKKRYFPYWIISKIAKKVVFVSHYTKKEFERNYGESVNYYLVQHGLMPINGCSNIQESIASSSHLTLIFFGRVEYYKGVDIFLKNLTKYKIEIHGRWSKNLFSLKSILEMKDNIIIKDEYISELDICNLINRESVFILPYKSATQSGVLYTLLAHHCVFICSNVGENYDFLVKHGLHKLAFDRDNEESIENAVSFAIENYSKIKKQMALISKSYEWEYILNKNIIENIYG